MAAVIYCDRPSNAALLLSRALNIPKVRDNVRGWRAVRDSGLIINYGSKHYPEFGYNPDDGGSGWLNDPHSVATAISKVDSHRWLTHSDTPVPTIEITQDPDVAAGWGTRVLLRHDGMSGGRGIRICEAANLAQLALVPMPEGGFYSRYFPKTHEFRVHVAGGQVIHVQQKKAVAGIEVNRLIRTHKNGWVFAERDFVILPVDLETIKTASINACSALGLDFGAVDVLVRLRKTAPRRMLQFAICEVNTAPGLESTNTLNAYVNYFRTEIGG